MTNQSRFDLSFTKIHDKKHNKMVKIEIVAVSNVHEEQEIRLTFDDTTRISDMIGEILDELDLDIAEMFDIYHNGKVVDLCNSQEIRDTEITADNNRIDIVMSEKYRSFFKDIESKTFEGDFYDYIDFCQNKQILEDLLHEIDVGPLGEYLKDPKSVFDLKSVILYSKMKCLLDDDSDDGDMNLLRLVNQELADGYSRSGYCGDDGYIAMNPEYLFRDARDTIDQDSPKTSLEVLAKLHELEKIEWREIYSNNYLDVWQGPDSSVLASFSYNASMAFLQYEDTYIFIARDCHYTCLIHNGFYDTDENQFQNGFYLGHCGRTIERVFEKMKGMCTSFYSDNKNPLFDALNAQDLDLARSVLEKDRGLIESVNEYRIPPLLIAARIGWLEAVKVLFEFTDDPNKEYSERGSGAIKTLMSCAKKSKNQELVEYLESIGVRDMKDAYEGGLNIIVLTRSESDYDSDSS